MTSSPPISDSAGALLEAADAGTAVAAAADSGAAVAAEVELTEESLLSSEEHAIAKIRTVARASDIKIVLRDRK
jgi:hypothetical protein|tara:strand:- start:1386 stop:1607 length:222 start_codon:yes stop_codon:yes gene_type:complete